MSTPFNGWASAIAIQQETTFNAASAATVYSLVGKTRFTQSQQFLGRTSKTDVWRNSTDSAVQSSTWNGTIEIELGFNAVTQLLLASFFDLYATASVGSLTQYSFRPHRLGLSRSLKVGVSFLPGGPYWIYSGVVLDTLSLSIMRNQTPKLTMQYRAAQYTAGGANPLGSPTTVTKLLANQAQCGITLNAAAVSNLYEANFAMGETKSLNQFGADGIATRVGKDGMFSFTGQLSEYFHGASPLPGAVQDQIDRAFVFTITDPTATGRLLTINWPRVNFKDGRPDGIGKGDLAYRVNFMGLQDSAINDASQPNLIFVA